MFQVLSRSARREGVASRGGAENADWSAELAFYRYHCNLREKAGRILEDFLGRGDSECGVGWLPSGTKFGPGWWGANLFS